jgi:hypothetical protein
MSELVTLRAFSSSVDFEMVKAYLESCGIKCYEQDEIINRAYFSNVNGGVKLQVSESQVEEAVQLLIDGGYLKPEDLDSTPEFKWAERQINRIKSFFEKEK